MIHTGDEKLPILSCMIAMAHGLGLTVTAEGVETAAQAEYLMKLDCDSLQGFLFSRPTAGPGLRSAIARSNDRVRRPARERVSGPAVTRHIPLTGVLDKGPADPMIQERIVRGAAAGTVINTSTVALGGRYRRGNWD